MKEATRKPLPPERLGNPLHCVFDILSTVKCRNAEISFACGTKTSAGRANHVAGLQQLVKEIPT